MDNPKPPACLDNPKLFACPDCGAKVSRGAYNCPTCGKKLRSTPINFLAWIILGCLAVGVLIVVGSRVEPFLRWTAYPNQKEDEQRLRRAEDARDWHLQRTGRQG